MRIHMTLNKIVRLILNRTTYKVQVNFSYNDPLHMMFKVDPVQSTTTSVGI